MAMKAFFIGHYPKLMGIINNRLEKDLIDWRKTTLKLRISSHCEKCMCLLKNIFNEIFN